MLILGLESSCDDTGAAVIRAHPGAPVGEILASVVRGQDALHAAYGGVVPEIAARAHLEHLDGLVRQALDEAKDKAPSADRTPVEKAIGDLRSAIAGDSVEDIEAKTKALQIASVNLGAKVHEASGASTSSSGESSGTSSGEDVVDADFEEVDDKDGQRHG